MDDRAVLAVALVGRYEVEREVGRGGMASVYLARDVRHGRHVALKLLAPEIAAGLGVERFLSEIRVTANLQHPNLLPLFDSGVADGLLYYVMPYVEGESLRARLVREKQLPVDQAIHIAIACANALDHAHRHGVVHRDLKPENILLQDGQPLIADFGIALAVSLSGGERITQTGVSVGTPQYMSPEQAAGERVVDGRSDIYSLGAILYEMLCGEPPYTGATPQAIIGRVLTENPRDVRSIRKAVPEHIARAIAKALQVLPADRFQHADEFAQVLSGERIIVPSAPPEAPASTYSRPQNAWLIPTMAVGLGVAGLALVLVAAASRSDAPTGTVSFFLSPTGTEDIDGTSIAVSRDGMRIAYIATDSGKMRIYVRTLGEPQAHVVLGTDGARSPRFSPDGASLAYFGSGSIQLVTVNGGTSQRVFGGIATSQNNFTWIDQDRIILPTRDLTARRSGLSEITVSTGHVRALIASDSGHGEMLTSAYVAPNHKDVLMVSAGPGGLEDDFLAFGSLDGGPHVVTKLLATRVLGMYRDFAIYTQLTGVSTLAINAVRVDLKHHRTIGSPVVLLDGVRAPALSDAGTLIYGVGPAPTEVVWIDATGTSTVILPATSERAMPRLSPDNRALAFISPGNPTTDVSIYDFASQALTRLTVGGGQNPEWTSDSKSILYDRPTTALSGLWLARVDGSSPQVQLKPLVGGKLAAPLNAVGAPDGRTVMFTATDSAGHSSAYYWVPSSGNDSAVVWNPGSDVLEPRFSPDQKWVAYTSTESGVPEVFVRAFPGPGPRVQISADGADKPLWSPDGTTIYYRHGPKIVVARIALQPSVVVLSRRDAFPSTGPCVGNMPYDISRDGKHLICARARAGAVKTVVTAHWFDEVRKMLPK